MHYASLDVRTDTTIRRTGTNLEQTLPRTVQLEVAWIAIAIVLSFLKAYADNQNSSEALMRQIPDEVSERPTTMFDISARVSGASKF